MGIFRKYKITSNGQYFFNFDGNNYKTIITSEWYKTKAGCENGIRSVRSNAPYEHNYRRFTDSKGEYRFNLLAVNGEIIGRSSEGYKTAWARDQAIELVKREAPTASEQDLTGE